MSVSIEIYQSKANLLSVNIIKKDVNKLLENLLSILNKKSRIEIDIVKCDVESESIIQGALGENIVPSDAHYYLVRNNLNDSVFCFYYWEMDEIGLNYLREISKEYNSRFSDENLFGDAIKLKAQWVVKREGDQELIVNIILGILASVIANKVSGVINSDDYLSNSNLFPCSGMDLFEFYKRLNDVDDNNSSAWLKEAIETIE